MVLTKDDFDFSSKQKPAPPPRTIPSNIPSRRTAEQLDQEQKEEERRAKQYNSKQPAQESPNLEQSSIILGGLNDSIMTFGEQEDSKMGVSQTRSEDGRGNQLDSSKNARKYTTVVPIKWKNDATPVRGGFRGK